MKRFAQHALRMVPLETELFHALRRLVLCSIAGATLGGCINFYRATGSEPTDLSAIQVGATRQTVERVLGEPVAIGTKGSMQIATYEYSLGIEAEPVSILRIPAEAVLLILSQSLSHGYTIREGRRLRDDYFDRPEGPTAFLTITYGPDDTAVEVSGKPPSIQEVRARAEEGDAKAQFDLALKYYDGRDNRKMWQWMCRAANQGHQGAQVHLGLLYRDGMKKPIPQNFSRAYMWFSLAASNGDNWAAIMRNYLAEKMTPAQILEAERMVREWKPGAGSCEFKSKEVSS